MTMKVVSRRSGKEDPVRDSKILQDTVIALRGRDLVPRGVYRFKSHEEADRWMKEKIAATHARRGSRTSSSSADR